MGVCFVSPTTITWRGPVDGGKRVLRQYLRGLIKNHDVELKMVARQRACWQILADGERAHQEARLQRLQQIWNACDELTYVHLPAPLRRAPHAGCPVALLAVEWRARSGYFVKARSRTRWRAARGKRSSSSRNCVRTPSWSILLNARNSGSAS